jgi:3-oxoacyl-[acyl-carrier-protein] synthase-3
MGLHLHSVGHFHPELEITNRFLEDLDIGTDDAWIQGRVGIRSRRTVLPLDYIRKTRNREPRAALEVAVYSNAQLARRAAEMALARAGIERDAVGMVIAGSSATDTAAPAEACNVASALGLRVPAFDVNSACTSWFAQLHLLSCMQPDPARPFVLLVLPEGLTRTVNYDDRSAAVLWGDGAGAAVVSTVEPGRAQILFTSLASDPAGCDKVRVPRLGHFEQNGRAVQAFAIRRSLQVLDGLRRARGACERPLHFIGHQANLRMLEAVCREAGIGPEFHHTNVTEYGNTGAASVASVLSMHWEKWTGEQDVALAGVGAGLTWGGCLVRFKGPA